MTVQIQPTGSGGRRRSAERQTRQVWEQLQPEAWNALNASQRWEIVRRVLVFVLLQSLDDRGR